LTVALRFLTALRGAGLPVSIGEYLTLLGALRADLAERDLDAFHRLARTILVKDERHLDRFDSVFARTFAGLGRTDGAAPAGEIPPEWLMNLAAKVLSEEEMAAIAGLGDLDRILETLRQRLAEQKRRHQGGTKWIGTGGTSPFGAEGYNPEGVRIGQRDGRHGGAVKVWEKRLFADLDADRALDRRNLKLALRKLRRFAREGAAEELDLDGTVKASAARGHLDLVFRPERRNTIKILLLIDIGGSMDEHVLACEELFAAARDAFKSLDHYYFHNCPYERVWKENERRAATSVDVAALIARLPPTTRLILVGDATMSPYEFTHPGGSVEHWNEEPGTVWLQRLKTAFPRHAWLNPKPERVWTFTRSIGMLRRALDGRMYPLTLSGIERAIGALRR
jgi:uncharacterized protein with von Willebrand factor type A (vWA) domain